MMTYTYLPYLIGLFIVVTVAVGSLIAFKSIKNWATITLLTGSTLFVISAIETLYWIVVWQLGHSSPAEIHDSEDTELYTTLSNLISLISPFIIIVGFLGYFITSRKIYAQSKILTQSNKQLSEKLTR